MVLALAMSKTSTLKAKFRDSIPTKLQIIVPADLHERHQTYQRLYAETYGEAEQLTELIPAMLEAFIAGDRAFARRRSKATSE